jgi:hypothetical protein
MALQPSITSRAAWVWAGRAGGCEEPLADRALAAIENRPQQSGVYAARRNASIVCCR